MPLTNQLRDDILASVPSLRAFAISLSGNGDRADDLVQETLLRAIANIVTAAAMDWKAIERSVHLAPVTGGPLT